MQSSCENIILFSFPWDTWDILDSNTPWAQGSDGYSLGPNFHDLFTRRALDGGGGGGGVTHVSL